jgi:hypothetical protein
MPIKSKIFSLLLSTQTVSEEHPTSYTMSTLGVKRPSGEATANLHTMPKLRMSEDITSLAYKF